MVIAFFIAFGYVCIFELTEDTFSKLRCAYSILFTDNESDWEGITDHSKINCC